MTRRRLDDDSGNITMLSLGFAVLAVLLILTVAAATAVHVDRVRASRLADDVAVDVADTLDLAAFYAGTLPEPTDDAAILIDEDALAAIAVDSAAEQAARYGLDEVRVVEAYSPDGRTVVVTIEAISRPIFGIDALTPWRNGISIVVTASARAY